MTQIDELVKRARSVDEEKLNVEPWTCEQLIKGLADALEAQAAENARLKERLGPHGLVVVEFNGVGHYVSEAVAAHIAALERVIAWANNSLFGSHSFFLSLNGGEDKEHHLDTAIENLKEQTRNYWSRITTLEAQLKAFRAAARGVSKAPAEHRKYGTVLIITEYWFDALMSALAASQRRDGPEVLALRNAEGEKNGVE